MLRRDYYILGTICCAVLFLGCDKVYRVLDKEGAEEKKLVGETLPFENNPTVEEIQRLLKLYGYSPGNIDGKLGPSTRAAVAKFQEEQNLPVTRSVGQETWEKLNVFVKNGLVKDGALDIRLAQQLLLEAGFKPGGIDGKLGPATIRAVKAFQKANNIKSDGKIGYNTLLFLSRYMKKTNQ